MIVPTSVDASEKQLPARAQALFDIESTIDSYGIDSIKLTGNGQFRVVMTKPSQRYLVLSTAEGTSGLIVNYVQINTKEFDLHVLNANGNHQHPSGTVSVVVYGR